MGPDYRSGAQEELQNKSSGEQKNGSFVPAKGALDTVSVVEKYCGVPKESAKGFLSIRPR
jgi:hypothetical protein